MEPINVIYGKIFQLAKESSPGRDQMDADSLSQKILNLSINILESQEGMGKETAAEKEMLRLFKPTTPERKLIVQILAGREGIDKMTEFGGPRSKQLFEKVKDLIGKIVLRTQEQDKKEIEKKKLEKAPVKEPHKASGKYVSKPKEGISENEINIDFDVDDSVRFE